MKAVLKSAVVFGLGGFIFGSLLSVDARALEANVVLVGDSVLSALNPRDTNFAQTVIGANRWNVKIDAKPCRCATTPGCKNGTPESVRNVLTARNDLSSNAVVIMVGHNDPRNESFRAKVDSVLAAAEKSPMIFWVTMREVSASYRVANRILAEEAQKRKNVRLVPWAGVSQTRAEWFAKDGVHLRTAGARKLAETILRELEQWRSKSEGGRRASRSQPQPSTLMRVNA
jgi:hypothetical protein